MWAVMIRRLQVGEVVWYWEVPGLKSWESERRIRESTLFTTTHGSFLDWNVYPSAALTAQWPAVGDCYYMSSSRVLSECLKQSVCSLVWRQRDYLRLAKQSWVNKCEHFICLDLRWNLCWSVIKPSYHLKKKLSVCVYAAVLITYCEIVAVLCGCWPVVGQAANIVFNLKGNTVPVFVVLALFSPVFSV